MIFTSQDDAHCEPLVIEHCKTHRISCDKAGGGSCSVIFY